MNKIQLFYNYVYENVETFDIDGVTLFVAQDVCNLLEIPFFTINQLESNERTYLYKPNNPRRKISLINEAGLYSLAFESETKMARMFTDFYDNEVKPSIEKYGAYIPPEIVDRLLEDEEFRKEFTEELAGR